MQICCANFYSSVHFIERLLTWKCIRLNLILPHQSHNRSCTFLLKYIFVYFYSFPSTLIQQHRKSFKIFYSNFWISSSYKCQALLTIRHMNNHSWIFSACWHLASSCINDTPKTCIYDFWIWSNYLLLFIIEKLWYFQFKSIFKSLSLVVQLALDIDWHLLKRVDIYIIYKSKYFLTIDLCFLGWFSRIFYCWLSFYNFFRRLIRRRVWKYWSQSLWLLLVKCQLINLHTWFW